MLVYRHFHHINLLRYAAVAPSTFYSLLGLAAGAGGLAILSIIIALFTRAKAAVWAAVVFILLAVAGGILVGLSHGW